ncbi:hypothetical protein O9H85_14275 [Paenibacillus filicis]|uniref:Uncharacterized protein n=1 Tax=Paenibacillus gyeongsangnamensis TaxID=3388067 RepID=A0ABT4Q9M7_9BACL|nr:hypothetical protein [Paenibacillus filicis]MCZ8513579.1 hypothetical protein [Paenibacillus filicis]
MNWHEEENRVKLHVLHSLARSQRALARIIESMADMAEGAESLSGDLGRQLEAISRYQREIAVKMIGVRIRRLRRGVPGKPWLSEALRK